MLFGPNQKKVQKWKETRNIEMLVKAMASNDFEIKAVAVEALGELQHKVVAPELIQMLKHPISSLLRREAAKALGRMRPSSAIVPLIKALGDDSPEVRKVAAVALKNMTPQSILPLRNQLNDFYHENIRQGCRSLLKELGTAVIAPLIEGLQTGTYGIREESAILLGEIGNVQGREALTRALNDKRIEVRKAAAVALKGIGWKPAKDTAAANFYIANGQFAEAFALGKPVREAFIAWLSDEDAKVRRQAAVALHKLEWRPQNREEMAAFWAAAGKFSELVKMGDDATDILVRLLGDRSLAVKKSAAKALKVVGVPHNVRQLVKDIDMMSDFTLFRLSDGTFNLEEIGPNAQHFRGKYYLLRVDNCDKEQRQHIQKLYPNAEVIDESQAL